MHNFERVFLLVFYSIFSKLCKQRGISETAALQEIGLSSGNLKNWKDGRTPKTNVLNKVALYFGVSMDYLLGKTEIRNDVNDEDIKFALFGGTDEITDEIYNEVKSFAQYIKEKYKKKSD